MSRYAEEVQVQDGSMDAVAPSQSGPKKSKIPIDKLLDYLILLLGGILVSMLLFFFAVASLPHNSHNPVIVLDSFLPRDLCEQMVAAAEALSSWTTMRHRNYPTTDIPLYLLNDVKVNLSQPRLLPRVNRGGAGGSEVLFGQWVNDTLLPQLIYPQIYRHFSAHILPPWRVADADAGIEYDPYSMLSIQDIFLVKYDASSEHSQHNLAMHIDSSMFSFNIALNDFEDTSTTENEFPPNEEINRNLPTYTNGGTRFFLSSPSNQSEEGFANRLRQGSMLLHPSKTPHEGVAVTSGIRYILVGFIRHRFAVPPDHVLQRDKVIKKGESLPFLEGWRRFLWVTYHRITTNYGRHSQCVHIQHFSLASQPAGSQLSHCKSLLAVIWHEVGVVYRDFFLPPDSRRYGAEQREKEDPFQKGLSNMYRFFKQSNLVLVAGGVALTLLAGCMMCYEYLYVYVLRYKQRQLASKQKKQPLQAAGATKEKSS